MINGPIDDERLRKMLLSVPAVAIKVLYDRYRASLVNLAARITGTRHEAEDVVQDAFVVVWRKSSTLGEYRGAPIVNYLIRVVKFRALTHCRDRRRFLDRMHRYLHSLPTTGPPDLAEITTADHEPFNLRSLLAQFPLRERQCLLLRLDENLTNRAIADRLGISVKAVERSITAARKRLGTCYRPDGQTIAPMAIADSVSEKNS